MKGTRMEKHKASDHTLFAIHSERGAAEHRIRVAGELDLAVTGLLDREVRRVEATDAPKIVIDLGDLEFLDASGAALLFDLERRFRCNGRRLRLSRPSFEQVRRVLDVTGIGEKLLFEAA
jgi:anti-sigma B factor antagonist